MNYFSLVSDLAPSERTSASPVPPGDGQGNARTNAWIQWFALLAGVIVQPLFATYQKTGHWALAGFWGWLGASVIIAIVAFPAVYKSAFDPTKPWWIQVIPIFTAGLGWNTLFSAAVQVAGGASGAAGG